MIVLNFSHPITNEQQLQIVEITGNKIKIIHDIESQFENQQPFSPQIVRLVESIPLTAKKWQTEQILIVPPSYNFAAMTLLAELHGKMGYMPAIIRLRPVKDAVPPSYEVAEVINLQHVRDEARKTRTD